MAETTTQNAETRSYPTALGFCLTSAFWMVVATFMGLLAATELIAPDLSGSLGWITFGRVRPVHINLVLFGFVTPGLLAAAFYYFPRLLRTEVYSEKIGVLNVLLLLNPTDAYRLFNLAGSANVSQFAGMAGLASSSVWSTSALLAALMLWVVVPLAFAVTAFARREV